MDTVIVAFENAALSRQLSQLLESADISRCLICQSGDQIRRQLSKQSAGCVVCSPHLTDGPAEWLYPDLPASCSLLLVGTQNALNSCTNPEIFKLAAPLRREEAAAMVRLLLQFARRLERLSRSGRGGAEQALVERAKGFLMAAEGLSEGDAHWALQKRSMDAGERLVQTAQRVLQGLEGPKIS